MITIVLVIGCILLLTNIVSGQSKQRFCGPFLSKMISFVCAGEINYRTKKAYGILNCFYSKYKIYLKQLYLQTFQVQMNCLWEIIIHPLMIWRTLATIHYRRMKQQCNSGELVVLPEW